MKKIFNRLAGLIVAAVPMLFLSCEQDSSMDLPLAVDHTALELKENGGTTNFIIYSTGEWNVALSKPVDWISLSVLAGKGKGNVEISASPNYGVVRRVDLLIQGQGETKVIKLTQAGKSVIFNFVEGVNIGKEAAKVKALFENNLGAELVNVRDSVAYKKYIFSDEDDEDVPEPEEGWISGIDLSEDGFINFSVTENTSDKRPRKAEIWLIYEDAREKVHKASLEVIQDIVTKTPVEGE